MMTHRSPWNPRQWLLDLMGVWRDTRLMVLSAQIAAVYAAILIPFKVGIPLIPGFAELRPANAIPLVTSLLFGPAAAWGAGIGNIIGDCFGTLGPASFFGFFGNFFLGYIPFLLWGHLGIFSSGRDPIIQSWRQGLEYVIVCLVASGVCASTIGWGVELLGLLPFTILAPTIFVNNVLMGLVLGPPLLKFLYPRVKRWGLFYGDLQMEVERRSVKGPDGSTLAPNRNPGEEGEEIEQEVPLVDVREVTFQYRQAGRPALENVSFQVKAGETVVLLGRSGSGKSTACYTLNGMVPQFLNGRFSGSVRVLGQHVEHRPVWEQSGHVGLVFQDFDTQLVSTNVEMELAYPLEHLVPPLSQADMQGRMRAMLQRVNLDGLERRDPLSLSGGQRQRLVIASTLIRQPELLVLDQPMTDLDPAGRRELIEVFQQLKAQGMTCVLTEQDPEDAVHADRVVVLDAGRVIWEGTPGDFWGRVGLPEQCGIRPFPLAQCFVGLDVSRLPMTVEEAWTLADRHGLSISAKDDVQVSGSNAGLHISSNSTVPVLTLQDVSFAYPHSDPVLQQISLEVYPGEFMAILGKNGSGKSTLVKLFNGLHLPTQGSVIVCGQNTCETSMGQLAGLAGYVFQNPDHQIFAETVGEEIAFGAKNVGCTLEECQRRVKEAIAAVGLDADMPAQTDPFSLTKGERQRVAVASVLAARPQVLIFDEPTTGLDAEETYRMMAMIQGLNRQGHTIIMITHAMWLVAEYAHRCVLMKNGTILADGPTREIFSKADLIRSASLELPPITRFAQRWGVTMLTVEEVRKAMKLV